MSDFVNFLEPQTTIYKWLFQLDDSQSLYRKLLFHQTSIYKWLFGFPGCQFVEAVFFGCFLRTPAILVHRAKLKKLVRYMIRLLCGKSSTLVRIQFNQAPLGKLYQ